jgi:hypothetical protein
MDSKVAGSDRKAKFDSISSKRILLCKRAVFCFQQESYSMSQALSMFNSVGPAVFSNMACQLAPYFSTINTEISELSPGHAVFNVPAA